MMLLAAITGVLGGLLFGGTIIAANWTGLRAIHDALSHPTALERRKKKDLARLRKRAGLPPVDETAEVPVLRRRATRLAWWAVLWRYAVVGGIVAGGYLLRTDIRLGTVAMIGVSLAYWVATGHARRTRTHRMREVAPLLRVFLADDRPHSGHELVQITGWSATKVYSLLAQLEGAGWLKPLWETAEPPAAASEPSRRRYCLSADSAAAARYELDRRGGLRGTSLKPARQVIAES